MRVLLVGVSCVGKTTIGTALARRLRVPFFDLDAEIERHFDMPIERLQHRFMTGYSYRKECSVVLERIAAINHDYVVALPPSGLRDAFLRVVQKLDCVTVAIQDRPENILHRIAFYDENSKLVERRLSDEEKVLCLREIKRDMSFFGRFHRRANVHADISGLGIEESAELIEELVKQHQRGTTTS